MYPNRFGRADTILRASQNFITSIRIIERLVHLSSLGPCDRVLEIGPGKGHITRALASRCAQVTAVELDPRLYAALCAKFSGYGNIELLQNDFLAYHLPEAGPYKVFSNIPFNRTTDIVRKLTEAPNPPLEMWLVVEKGAAKRFMGKPRESLRSLLIKPAFTVEIVYHFRREDFHPMPSVDAVLMHLERKAQPDISPAEMPAFSRFVTSGMNGGLNGLVRHYTKRRVVDACHAAGVSLYASPGDILYVQWLCLYRNLSCKPGVKGHG